MAAPKVKTLDIPVMGHGIKTVRLERHATDWTVELDALGMPYGGQLGSIQRDGSYFTTHHHDAGFNVKATRCTSLYHACAYLARMYYARLDRDDATLEAAINLAINAAGAVIPEGRTLTIRRK